MAVFASHQDLLGQHPGFDLVDLLMFRPLNTPVRKISTVHENVDEKNLHRIQWVAESKHSAERD